MKYNIKIQKDHARRHGLVLLCTGLFLCAAEIWKQLYLYFFVFHSYNIWYLPWQLCSMPLYLCPAYALLSFWKHHSFRNRNISDRTACTAAQRSEAHLSAMQSCIAAFLADYGMLGGIAALIVHSGFTFPDHPLLTLHGYLWHITLILLSLYLTKNRLFDTKRAGFLKTLPLFFASAGIAEFLNIGLHRFGDCDMFYISPYHLSAQPVFSDIDRMLGRVPGIFIYLAAVVCGAFLVHLLLGIIQARQIKPKSSSI